MALLTSVTSNTVQTLTEGKGGRSLLIFTDEELVLLAADATTICMKRLTLKQAANDKHIS